MHGRRSTGGDRKWLWGGSVEVKKKSTASLLGTREGEHAPMTSAHVPLVSAGLAWNYGRNSRQSAQQLLRPDQFASDHQLQSSTSILDSLVQDNMLIQHSNTMQKETNDCKYMNRR